MPQPQETDPQPHRAPKPLIQIKNLSKNFGAGEADAFALQDIQLTIAQGEYVALSGPSGCGKSTLLSIIGLLDTPTSGSYLLDGRDVSRLTYTELSSIRNQEIGFIFQSFHLIEELTVYENIALPLSFRRSLSTTEQQERIHTSLARVGMDHRSGHYPSQLSGGQQQRIAVARALAGSPSILLADEPTGNLDSHHGEAVMELLNGLHKDGTTICLVTHNPQFAAYAERQVHLFDGKITSENMPSKYPPA